MNACKQQEEKMLSWLISRTFKYHFSTSWTFDGSCFNTVRKGFKVKGIPGFGNTSLSSMNTCLRQNIKQCNRIVFPSEKCNNLLLNWEQTSFQVYYCWGSTFSQSVGEYSRALMQNLRWLEAKLFPRVPFIHTWNVKTWLWRTAGSCWCMTRNERAIGVYQGAVFKTTPCHRQHFVVETLFDRQPVKSSQD